DAGAKLCRCRPTLQSPVSICCRMHALNGTSRAAAVKGRGCSTRDSRCTSARLRHIAAIESKKRQPATGRRVLCKRAQAAVAIAATVIGSGHGSLRRSAAAGRRLGAEDRLSLYIAIRGPDTALRDFPMNMRRMTAIAIGLTIVSAGALRAQTQETKTTTKTKVEMKGGKDVTVVGCLERRDNGDYMLTNIREASGMDLTRYALITEDDLTKRVGERVRIEGKTVSAGGGTVSVKSDTKTEVENGRDVELKARTLGTTGTRDVPFLGVKSVKTLSSSCS